MLPVWKGCPVARSDRKFDVPESAFDEAPGWRAFLLVSWFPDVPRHRNCRMDSGSRHKPVRHENAFHIQRMHLLILLFRRRRAAMIFGFFICFHLACTYTIRNVYVNNQYVLYTYIVSKQVMNSHRTQADTDPRFGLNGTNPHFSDAGIENCSDERE